jgi:hypothetical protein
LNPDTAPFGADYPLGFADPSYLEQIRRPLQAAHDQARHTLAREVLSPRVSQRQFDQACADAVTVLRVPGAFPADWADRLEAALGDEASKRDFTIRLNGLLHIEQPIDKRFEGFAAVLGSLDLLDWPMVSVFPALVFPERFFLVDPAGWSPQAGLTLSVAPEWASYRESQRWAHQLKKQLAELGPVDLLDVHALLSHPIRSGPG